MAFRRPKYMDRRPAQAVPFAPQSGYKAPYNPFMPNEFSNVPGIESVEGFQAKPSAAPAAPQAPAQPFNNPFMPSAFQPVQPPLKRQEKPSYRQKEQNAGEAPKTKMGGASTSSKGTPGPSSRESLDPMQMMSQMMPGMLSPEQIQKMREQMQNVINQGVSRRRNLLDKMYQRYENTLENKPDSLSDIDFTPAYMLADMLNRPFTPTNLMEQALGTEESRLLNSQIQGVQAGMQGGAGFGGLQRGILSLLRAKYNRDEIRDLYEKRRDDRREEKNIRGTFKDLSKIADAAAEGRNDVAMVVDGIRDGSIARVEFAISKLTRLAGQVGVLTEKDLDLTRMNTLERDLRSWEGYVKGDPTIQVPPRILAQMEAAVSDSIRAMQDAMASRVKTRKEIMGSADLYGPTQGQTNQMFNQVLQEIDQTFQDPFKGSTRGAKGLPELPPDEELMNMSEEELRKIEKQYGL